MSGLAIMTQSLSVPSATGTSLDIVRELGLTQARLQFDQRTKALVHPDTYKNERNVQFDKMTTAVKKTYQEVLQELTASGLPKLQVQQLAINAAAATKAVQEGILESLFPSGSTAVAMQSEGRAAFPGMLSAPSASMSGRVPRRAPRRKATARKRK